MNFIQKTFHRFTKKHLIIIIQSNYNSDPTKFNYPIISLIKKEFLLRSPLIWKWNKTADFYTFLITTSPLSRPVLRFHCFQSIIVVDYFACLVRCQNSQKVFGAIYLIFFWFKMFKTILLLFFHNVFWLVRFLLASVLKLSVYLQSSISPVFNVNCYISLLRLRTDLSCAFLTHFSFI